MMLSASIEGIGLLGPGLSGWPESAVMCAGQQPYQPQKTVLPPPALLPSAERRHSGAIIKRSLAVNCEAIAAAEQEAAHLPTVFSSSGGDGDTCHAICEVLASDDRRISPTRFHNSVHTAAAGYWSIATGAMTPASMLSAYDGSFCAGLLEALTQVTVDHTRSVLLQRSNKSLAKISARLTEDAADRLDDEALEDLRQAIPAARGLPLMRTIARRDNRTLVLDYLDNLRVAVAIEPC